MAGARHRPVARGSSQGAYRLQADHPSQLRHSAGHRPAASYGRELVATAGGSNARASASPPGDRLRLGRWGGGSRGAYRTDPFLSYSAGRRPKPRFSLGSVGGSRGFAGPSVAFCAIRAGARRQAPGFGRGPGGGSCKVTSVLVLCMPPSGA